MVQSMKYISPVQIGSHITKLQGDTKDVAFASSVDVTRQTLRNLKRGDYLPNAQTLAKLGLELTYRVIETPAKVTSPVVPAKAAKKAAKK